MKIEDIRKGNHLSYEKTTHIVIGVLEDRIYSWWLKDGEPQIDYIKKDCSGVKVPNPYIDIIDRYEPIELNEGKILRLGFRQQGNRNLWIKDKISLVINTVEKEVMVGFKDLSNVLYHTTFKIKYVHQLQNIINDLEGEE